MITFPLNLEVGCHVVNKGDHACSAARGVNLYDDDMKMYGNVYYVLFAVAIAR
jgi:hypothetical protein